MNPKYQRAILDWMIMWGLTAQLYFLAILFFPDIFFSLPTVYMVYAILPGMPMLQYVYDWTKKTQEFEEVNQ